MVYRQSEDARQRPMKRPLTWGISGADDGIRTRDPHLGKVMLYQLSHVRVSGRSRYQSVRGNRQHDLGRGGVRTGLQHDAAQGRQHDHGAGNLHAAQGLSEDHPGADC